MLTNAYAKHRDREAVKDWNRHIDIGRFQEPAQATVWNCECGWKGRDTILKFNHWSEPVVKSWNLCPECGAVVKRSKK